MDSVKIYGLSLSPYSSIAVMPLWQTGQEFEFTPIDFPNMEHKSEPFLAKNPKGKFPILEEGDFTIGESFPIQKYVIDKIGLDSELYPSSDI